MEDEAVDSRYRYSSYFTRLDLPAAVFWYLYRDRGDAENRIKEHKYDFRIEGFHLKNFWGTEEAFRFAIISYNLMSLFLEYPRWIPVRGTFPAPQREKFIHPPQVARRMF